MSDPTTSGGTSAASAAAPTETAGTPPIGAFGTSRGTGLARSKRPSQSAAKPAAATPADYQPSSIEVIRPKSEYKNPFTGETSVDAPARPEPVERVANEPAKPAAPPPSSIQPAVALVAPVAFVPVAIKPVPTPAAAPTGEMFPFTPTAKPAPVSTSEEKPRLNILPPAEVKRPAQSWESPGAARHEPVPAAQPPLRRERMDDRPVFRPERHDSRRSNDEPRSFDSRPPEPRRDPAKLDSASPAVPEEIQSVGFFGWLKSLFGGGKPKEKQPSPSGDSHRHDGGHRRHRGGRHRQGGSRSDGSPTGEASHAGDRGFRSEAGVESPRSGSSHDGQRSGEHRHDGGRRRRGGRNRRHRGDGGSYPRQEEGHRHSGGGSGLAPPPAS